MNLPKTPVQIKLYITQQHKVKFLTLEDESEVHSIIIYFQGTSGHSFYDFFQINTDFTEEILHQQAILKFFDDESSVKLHFLGKKSEKSSKALKELGFTVKNQTYLKMKKPDY